MPIDERVLPPREPQGGPGTAAAQYEELRQVSVPTSLTEEASSAGLTIERETPFEERVALRAQDRLDQEAELRNWVAKVVVPAFLKANGLTLVAVAVLVVLDEVNLTRHLIMPGDRIITSQVIAALIGATTIQVGAIAYAIGRYLFPSRSSDVLQR